MFQEALLNFNIKVSDLAIQAKSGDPKAVKELTEFLISGSSAIRKVYKKEFTELLIKKKALDKIEFISILVNHELEKSVKEYFIDDKMGMIHVEFKNSDAPLNARLADLHWLVGAYFFIDPKDPIFNVLIGYFTVPEHYQLVQLYNAIS